MISSRGLLTIFFLAVVFLQFQLATGYSTMVKITDNRFRDEYPSVHNGQVAWHGGLPFELIDFEIYYWDGEKIHQITDNDTYDVSPSLHDGKIAWVGDSDGARKIMYWDGKTTRQISPLEHRGSSPSLYNGQIAYTGDGKDGYDEIYFWDGTTIHQITNNNYNDMSPSLHKGKIAWVGRLPTSLWWATKSEIFYWDGSRIQQITDSPEETGNGYGNPSLYDGKIAFDGYSEDADLDIFHWNGRSITNITKSTFRDYGPALSKGNIVWQRTDSGFDPQGIPPDIYGYNGSEIFNISNTTSSSDLPSLHDGVVVWQENVDGDTEIYSTTIAPAKKIMTLPFLDVLLGKKEVQ